MKEQGSGKTQNPPLITAQTVSDALAKLGGAGAAAVADHLQAQTYKERSLVRKVLSSFLQAGGVKAVRQQGVVTYHLNDKPGRGGVQAKLWEFACLRFAVGKPFGAAEAARLAECDRDYVKRYYRWLWQSAYLAMITRGRAGAPLYQVVGGKEHEAAPAWNRRAEKRKSVGQAPSPVVLFPPAAPSPQPSPTRGEGVKCTCHPTMSYGHVECPVHGKGGDKDHRRDACATRLDAALEDFGRALVEVTGSIGRAWEIIREMKGELFALAAEEQGHDEPGEPTDGHH